MGKRLILILALAFVVGLTVAAYAEVQNVKVSGDILMEGISRQKLMLRNNNANNGNPLVTYSDYDRHVSTVLSHVRVRVDADLTDNVSTTVRLLNERQWGTEDTVNTDIDLDLAYVALKEFLYSPLSLTVGRQELHFGNDLIIGDIDTNNLAAGHGTGAATRGLILPKSVDDLSLRKSFDAIRATLNYDPLVVDAVFARISKTVDANNSVNLYGANANYALDKNTTVEAYYWLKKRDKTGSTATSIGYDSKNDTVHTIGARVQNSSIKNLTAGLEGAFQFGNRIYNATLYPDDVDTTSDYKQRRRLAYAIQLTSSYKLADLLNRVSTKVGSKDPLAEFSYTLLSGDPYKSRSSVYRGWDPMYENQAGGTLFNKILGYSNAQLFNVGLSLKPMEDLSFAFDYYYIRLMKAYRNAGADGNTTGNSATSTNVNLTGVTGDPTYNMVNGKKSLGNEFDATLTYDYTEDVQIGLNMGWFVPGSAFNKDTANQTNRKTATQVIGSMKVTF